MRALLLTAGSLFLTASVIGNAYYQKKQFYPSVVYITKSNPSMAVLYLQAFVFVILMGKLMRKIFFGQLRAAEMEHLIEKSWYAVTETCLAFTVFRDDFSPRFVALFTLLLFLKCFHWLAEDRVDYMERSPVISFVFHSRVISLLVFLGLLDVYFINHAYYSTLIKGASVQLVFGFEYAILFTVVMTVFVKYILHTVDLQSENPWENKAVCMLYTDLLLGFIKVVLYVLFLAIMIKVHTFPLFAIRPMYLTMRAFKKALNDVIMSRRAIRNMNTLYPDATEEELAAGDSVCIICRDEMTQGCKKLPCNHIFHTSCLRSWFQRQQTCPTCRRDVLRPAPRRQTPPTPQPVAEQQQQQQQQQPQQQQPGFFPGMPAGFPMWPPQQPAVTTPAASTASPSTAAPSTIPSTTMFSMAGSMPPFMPPFMMPMPLSMMPPMPPADFSGMTPEELAAMEGEERQHVESRIRCLRNIQTLLDAAVLQMNQYTNIMSSLRTNPSRMSAPPFMSMAGSTSVPSPSVNVSSPSPFVASPAAPSAAPVIPPPLHSETAQAVTSHSKPADDIDMGGLEGAVGGHSEPTPEAIPKWSPSQPDNQEDDLNEIRRRRLQHFTAKSPSNTDDDPDKIELD